MFDTRHPTAESSNSAPEAHTQHFSRVPLSPHVTTPREMKDNTTDQSRTKLTLRALRSPPTSPALAL